MILNFVRFLVGDFEFVKVLRDLMALLVVMVLLGPNVEPIHDSKGVLLDVLGVKSLQEGLLFWIEFVPLRVGKILPVLLFRDWALLHCHLEELGQLGLPVGLSEGVLEDHILGGQGG